MAAVSQNGLALQMAGKKMRKNKEIVLAAVSQNGAALQFASEKLRDDKAVVLAAVRCADPYNNNIHLFKHVSARLRNNNEVAFAAVKNQAKAVHFVGDILKNKTGFFNKCIELNYLVLNEIEQLSPKTAKKMRSVKSIMMSVVKQNGKYLKFCSEDLRQDKEMVREAMTQTIFAAQFAGSMSADILMPGLQGWLAKFNHSGERLNNSTRDMLLKVLNQLRQDKQFVNDYDSNSFSELVLDKEYEGDDLLFTLLLYQDVVIQVIKLKNPLLLKRVLDHCNRIGIDVRECNQITALDSGFVMNYMKANPHSTITQMLELHLNGEEIFLN